MNGKGSNRMVSPVRRSLLAIASLLACAPGSPGMAQPPTIAATAPPPPVDLDPVPGATRPAPSPLPASTVSPAIERFVRERARLATGAGSMTPAAEPRSALADRPPLVGPSRPPIEPSRPQELPPALPDPSGPGASDRQGPGRPAANLEALAATGMTLKRAPLDKADRPFPINLATALRLSDARPLVVAAAQAGVWVAEAELTRAKVLWVPTVQLGVDYVRHDGGGPDFNKGILTAPSVNYFYAGGTIYQSINLADAIFQPLAARQVLDARNYDVQSAKNDALLRTADAYFGVHQYRGNYAGHLYAVERGKDLVAKITVLSADLVRRVEIERARNLLADLEQRAASARQEWRVRSADLTQVLRLDPRAVVEPTEHDHTQITLIDPGRGLDELMVVALTNRPELPSRRAQVQAAEVGVRREKARPLLPLVILSGFQVPGNQSFQGGIFGLGPNSSLNQFVGREDVSIQAVWQLEGFGVGNLARIKAQRGQESRSLVDLRRAQDMVVADVTRARARVQSAAARVLQADRALRTGIVSFNGQLEGLGQTRRFGDVLVLTYRPQEVIYSLDLLSLAFQEYFTTVADYNRSQFELFHALGYPARELADLRPPGEVLPVDTSRPAFLPPVGNGPPPATR